jgi:hypothetical protein
MEAFQIVGAHGDLARAKLFAQTCLQAQVACYGEDADDTEKWKAMVEYPSRYVKKWYSNQWETSTDRIPNFCGKELELWLWARKADGTGEVV